MAAFVGKFSPFHFKNQKTFGVFLATNPLGPEADDYLRTVKDNSPFNLRQFCGNELEVEIRRTLGLNTAESLHSLLPESIPVVCDEHIVHTNLGCFNAVVGTGSSAAFPDRFLLLGKNGIVDDEELISQIRAHIPVFRELEHASGVRRTSTFVQQPVRTIPEGISVGVGWLDYRRPASPDFFVGRRVELAAVRQATETTGRGTIVEVKSRSGVGKSSLLAALAAEWRSEGHIVEFHDARDVHSATDLLSLLTRFTRATTRPSSFEEAFRTLPTFALENRGKRLYFLVDQFEATFQNQEVFTAYEYLAMTVSRINHPIVMLYARKDDLLTTHDDIAVDLARLRALSQSITLDDLSRNEASELLGNAAKAHTKRIANAVLSQVLEFAQGFPWLLKRTLAHVLSHIDRGIKQRELASAGLYLEDLFEEELRELDEAERGYLHQLAGYLPATYQHLLQRLEGDANLPRVLRSLTDRHLLRLSAGTYDTYNDVFKEFLLYQRLPDSSTAYIFRLSPARVMAAFRQLGGRNEFTTQEIGKMHSVSHSGTYSILRELRRLSLIVKTPTGWQVPPQVRTYEHQNRLAEYVRQSVLKNTAVARLLIELEKGAKVSVKNLPAFLQKHFAFVDASPSVWQSYAATFLLWLRHLRLAEVAGNGNIQLVGTDRENLSRELGNLELPRRGTRKSDAAFMPLRPWSVYVRIMNRLTEAELSPHDFGTVERDAVRDLLSLGAIRQIGDDRIVAVWTLEHLADWARNKFEDAPYKDFFRTLVELKSYEKAVQNVFGLSDLAPSTRTQLGYMLANWGRAFHAFPSHLRFSKVSSVDSGDEKGGLFSELLW
ncbi:MAG: nSTAND1 domain-containing NTPase [Phycisphaerae bacterium]